MNWSIRRVAVTSVTLALLGAVSFGCAPASAQIDLELTDVVWGSLTSKKTNEPVVLPDSSFKGVFEGTLLSEFAGHVRGHLTVPPFKATLKLGGVVPTTVGVKITEVGESQGTLATAPEADCAGDAFFGCSTLNVTARANIGITAAGFDGIEVPTECETMEPMTLALSETAPAAELFVQPGARFVGTVTIPDFTCSGASGVPFELALDTVESGPENPYELKLSEHGPSAPEVITEPAYSLSQISARLTGYANDRDEPLLGCEFEYGTSTSYGATAPCSTRPVDHLAYFAPLTGLEEGTTYHFRIVATNPLGTSYGKDETFRTLTGAPEYGICVVQKKGEYSGSGCGSKSSKPRRGAFEWLPGPVPSCYAHAKGEYGDAGCTTKSAKPGKGDFKKAGGPGFSSTGEAVTLYMPYLGSSRYGTTVTCTASSGAGEAKTANTGIDRITLKGCQAAGTPCTSEGPNSTPSGAAGAIVTNLLDTRLLGPLEGDVWTEFKSAEHAPYVAEFNCGGKLVRIKGSVSGNEYGDASGKPSATSTTTFAYEELNAPEQALFGELSEDGGSSWSGPETAALTGKITNTAAPQTEIKP